MASIVQSTSAPATHYAFKINTMVELKQHHARIIKLGLASDNDVIGRVIKLSASNVGDIEYALKVFDGTPDPDIFIYNVVMKGLVQREMMQNCIGMYLAMLERLVCPNSFSLPILVQACFDVMLGRQVHGHVVKFGFHSDVYCLNNLIQMYMKLQRLDDARRLFDMMRERNVVSWTTMVSGYSRIGMVDDAYEVFQLMDDKKSNSAACNAMLAAFVQRSRFHESFALFRRLEAENVALDNLMATSMLSACSGLGSLELGTWIHKKVEQQAIELDSKLAGSIIDMYCKCGWLEKAFELFNTLPPKVVSVSVWNSMIGGLAMHGLGESAVELFTEMERQKIVPDSITFVNLLSGCAHSGMVEQGQYYFQRMFGTYGIQRDSEHYGCMVDLFGRAGMITKAEELVEEMVQFIGPDASVLGALFGGCRIHGNIQLGEEIGHKLIELEPENSGRYVLLANFYANAGSWGDVASVRNLMSIRGVKKQPGSSMIELNSIVNEFTAGGRTHPETAKIYSKVHEMLERIRGLRYKPGTDGVLNDQGDEDKENPLHYHSEKLAIAYGLMHSKPGQILRVTKNLRVCTDCHEATKLISAVYDIKIVVRDRRRFHHFQKGECSCNDYW